MLGGTFIVILILTFVWLTVKNALQFVVPWVIAVVVAGVLLWLIVKLAKKSPAVQKIIAGVAIIAATAYMLFHYPLHATTIVCTILVGLTLFVAATIASGGPMRDKVLKVASAQLLWLIPLTLTVYTYSFIDPSEAVVPGMIMLLGFIAAIPLGAI